VKKLWFSLYDPTYTYPEDEPAFFEPEHQRWTKDFEENHEIIIQELNAFLEHSQLKTYFNKYMVNTSAIWKTISLRWWNVQFRKKQVHFPKTMKIVEKYPEIISLSFNQLEANGEILPHCSDTNAIFRCHLGMEIPETLPNCGFRVKEEMRSWEEGKWLIFVDANNHEAFNKSENRRIIMVIDVVRNEFKSKKMLVCSTVLTSLFLQKRIQLFPFMLKSPVFIRKAVSFLLIPFAFISIQIVNKFKIY
jgi:aspartyl/asparaginyl beta-hydroxylase (cupin superfamily)